MISFRFILNALDEFLNELFDEYYVLIIFLFNSSITASHVNAIVYEPNKQMTVLKC